MATKQEPLELIETLICKDITQLPNGTYTLTNLYPKDIAITQFPQKLAISLWMNFYVSLKESVELEIKISSESALKEDVIVPVTMNKEKNIQGAKAVPVIIKNIGLEALDEDEVEISYRHVKKKWKTARVFNIQKHIQSIH